MSAINRGLIKRVGETASEPVGDYVRPADWLTMPKLTESDEKIVMLVAVYDHSSNFVAFKCTGDYTVDWGDGSAPENVASGVQAERILDYEDFAGTECSRGYRQAIVTITPQIFGGLLTAELAQKHSAALSDYYSSALEIVASAAHITKITMYGSSYQTSIELFTLKKHLITNMSYMFFKCHSLRLIDLSDMASVSNASQMFAYCYALRIIDLSWMSSLQNIYQMFYACGSLQLIFNIDMASVSNASQMFAYCYSLSSVSVINTSIDISYTNCKLAATELNEIFTNLATVTDKTITITGNWGAATCDQSIATSKGWTVIS